MGKIIYPPPVGVIPDRSYDTPSLRVQRYWYRHPFRAFYLMRALMRENPRPFSREWPEMKSNGKTIKTPSGRWEFKISKERPQFRKPPQPYLGGCPMCGGVRYNLGWHSDWDGKGKSKQGWWHQSCSSAYRLMTSPAEFSQVFYDRQGGFCALTNDPLSDSYDIDHIIPLYRVFRDFGHLEQDELIGFWGPGNLRAITKEAHKRKNAYEAAERSAFRN